MKSKIVNNSEYHIIPHTTEYGEYYTIEADGMSVEIGENGEILVFDNDEDAAEWIFEKGGNII